MLIVPVHPDPNSSDINTAWDSEHKSADRVDGSLKSDLLQLSISLSRGGSRPSVSFLQLESRSQLPEIVPILGGSDPGLDPLILDHLIKLE